MKFAFAGTHSRYTELTAATAGGLIQTPNRLTAFFANARHSRREKQPTLNGYSVHLSPVHLQRPVLACCKNFVEGAPQSAN